MDAKEQRRTIAANQIKAAMETRGISRKALADGMGKTPSEVTRWLSGNHNFTLDLLSDLSEYLGTPITGVMGTSSLVSGYDAKSQRDNALQEPACSIGITLPPSAYDSLLQKARQHGTSVAEYAKLILTQEAERKSVDAMDFCGVWADLSGSEDELIAEIKGYRTLNTIHEL